MKNQEKEILDYIENTLSVKIGIRGEFVWNNIPLRYHWSEYGGAIELWVEQVNFNIKRKHLNAEQLCKYLIKNQRPLTDRYRTKLIRDSTKERNEQQLIEYLNSTKSERKINWDGQNILINTGKDPILVKMLLDAIERYEADQETITLIYK